MLPTGNFCNHLVCRLGTIAAPAALASPSSATRSAPLVITGLGGQTVAISVPAAGLDVDGPVGGVVIQRASDGRLVGGTMLLNAPGFDRAVGIELVDFGHTRLPKGRYRFTLLGRGHQHEDAEMCLQPKSAAPDAPCVLGDGGSFISPGAGGSAGWSAMLYPPGSLERTTYTFSGTAVGVGPSSTPGHAGVVIALRR